MSFNANIWNLNTQPVILMSLLLTLNIFHALF